jgi:hypothetical protein
MTEGRAEHIEEIHLESQSSRDRNLKKLVVFWVAVLRKNVIVVYLIHYVLVTRAIS